VKQSDEFIIDDQRPIDRDVGKLEGALQDNMEGALEDKEEGREVETNTQEGQDHGRGAMSPMEQVPRIAAALPAGQR